MNIRGLSISTALALLCALASVPAAGQESSSWTFGIGTGVKNQYVDGTIGFTSYRGAEEGPIKLKPKDFNDLMYSGSGFAFTAAKDKIRLTLSHQRVRLLDERTTIIAEGLPGLATRFQQDIVQSDVSFNYRFAVKGREVWGIQAGVHRTEHDYEVDIGLGSANLVERRLDQSWTDGVVALTYAHVFSPKLIWANRFGVGGGDSKSYWNVNTALSWQLGPHWAPQFFVDYTKVDFENDGAGDPYWYKYKADEWGPGIAFVYTFGRRGQ